MYGCTCARSPAYVRVRKREDERYSQEKNTPVASSRGPLRVEVIVSVRELVAVREGSADSGGHLACRRTRRVKLLRAH